MAEAGRQQQAPRASTARRHDTAPDETRLDDAGRDRLIAELEAAVRSRDEFLAIAAHELRNPMTPVLMQVTGLLRAALDPHRCQPELLGPRLAVLEHAVQDFVRRATTLLEVSRIAAGNAQIEPVPTDLSALVLQAVERARIAARLARCPVEAMVEPGIAGHWDPLALEQVTDNLLSNAIKFGAGHPVRVALGTTGAGVCLSVRDGGIGIAEADRARIFGRFERAVGQREHGGFGIGLWLANRLVTAMGGSIAVAGAPGGGTVFTVTLPADRTRTAPSAGRGRTTTSATAPAAQTRESHAA